MECVAFQSHKYINNWIIDFTLSVSDFNLKPNSNDNNARAEMLEEKIITASLFLSYITYILIILYAWVKIFPKLSIILREKKRNNGNMCNNTYAHPNTEIKRIAPIFSLFLIFSPSSARTKKKQAILLATPLTII